MKQQKHLKSRPPVLKSQDEVEKAREAFIEGAGKEGTVQRKKTVKKSKQNYFSTRKLKRLHMEHLLKF